MKLFTAFLLAAGLIACNPADQPVEDDAAEEAVEEGVDATQEAFNRTAKSRIEAMEEQMSQLADRVDEAPENMREELNAQIDDWQRRADDLEGRIDSFDAEGEQQWREFETRVNTELDDLDRSYNELSQRLTAPTTR
ncbi:MAG: hypothetical protein ACRD3V_05490 [Vicinamibacteria bacterium]